MVISCTDSTVGDEEADSSVRFVVVNTGLLRHVLVHTAIIPGC